ncbi:hypothetical protein MMC07_009137 [Pseudocyphellaria aurata]|nr:hypothetical protein [Pseudocyphellaria aurata]
MSHYVDFICLYESAQGFDTSYSEAAHKSLKDFFRRTNKRSEFEVQILHYNTRQQNMVAMGDVLLFTQSQPRSQADVDSEVQVTKPTRDPVNLTKLRFPCGKHSEAEMLVRWMKVKYWRTARDMDAAVGIPCFLDALAVFVWESRRKKAGVATAPHLIDHLEPNVAGCLKNCYVSLHNSMSCWERDGKDNNASKKLVERHAYCSPRWQRRNCWRRDCVWVQEHASDPTFTKDCPEALSGRLLGRLQLIVTVVDVTKRVHATHGMFKVERWPVAASRHPCNLGSTRFYEIPIIISCAHLVLTDDSASKFYVNSWVNWEAYNSIYDPGFLENNRRAAINLAKTFR